MEGNNNGFAGGPDGAPGGGNGRVTLMPGENGVPFHLFSDAGKDMKETMTCDALKGMEANETALLFMSAVNVDALQEAVRYQVFLRSQGRHTIGRQSDTELISVMRSMYLQYGRNTTQEDGRADLAEVKRLNSIVLDYCVDRIMAEINIYLTYRADISELPVPMQRGEFSSSKGSRSLVQKEF
jgi:hypothetical protein